MIYFIQQGSDGPVKIGHVEGDAFFKSRLNNLQVGSPIKLNLLGVMDGSKEKEAEIHSEFAAQRIRGEWFTPVIPLGLFINRNARDLNTKAPPEKPAKCKKSQVGKYMLRLDKELMDKVHQAADNNRQSINSQLCMIVENWAEKSFEPEIKQE